MKLLVDMNLSPQWVEFLRAQGWDSVHWSDIGDPRASDEEIMAWARVNQCVVFTHDLDFGAILAASGAESPSVIQIRGQDVLPRAFGSTIARVLQEQEHALTQRALLVVDSTRSRVRILPLQRS